MGLDSWPTRLLADQRERIESLLAQGHMCQGSTARLTTRQKGSTKVIALQCLTCGLAVGNLLPRERHPYFATYPEWDYSIAERYRAEAENRLAQRPQQYLARLAEKRSAYRDFLESSEEWQNLRALVLQRDGGICRACLTNKATQVHHKTYSHGLLPPAWKLHSVCKPCHERLHGLDEREEQNRVENWESEADLSRNWLASQAE